VLLAAAGQRYYPVGLDLPLIPFAVALLASTLCILSMGFVIAAMVPTARFAQPIGAVILYPMVALSGLFVPIASLPSMLQPLARVLPLTYVVSLLTGILKGEPWSAHTGDVGALAVIGAACIALSAKVFRWE
jgi:ABC-2 type transport system permease protein